VLVPVGLLEVLGGLLEVLDCWHGCWRWWQCYWRCGRVVGRWWQGCRRVVLGLSELPLSSSCSFLKVVHVPFCNLLMRAV